LELTVKSWEPPAELMRLLEAFAGEIVGSTDAEIQVTSTPTVAAARATLALVLRMRELIGDAIDEPAEVKERLLLPDLEAIGELRQRPN
jgi:hypothetical protein